MPRLILLLALAAPACGGHHPDAGPHGHGEHHGHRFQNPAEWAKRWDTAERDAWQKPSAVIAAMALQPGQIVADVGAGTGYFTVRFATALPEGRVYAVDIEPKMVAYVKQRAREQGLTNVEGIQATPDDAKLPEPVDVVFLCDTYHHIEERADWFRRIGERLKPGGRVVVVDYRTIDPGAYDGSGPPPAMRLAAGAVIEEMKSAGYRAVTRDLETLPRQYLLVFERTAVISQ